MHHLHDPDLPDLHVCPFDTEVTTQKKAKIMTSAAHYDSASSLIGRRALLGAAALAAVPLALPACSTSGSGGGAGGEVELTFLNQSRGQEAALTKLAQQYSEENGISITVDSPGPADYLAKLQAKAQSGDMPDVYSSFSATDMAAFYKAGWAMDLRDALSDGWSENFSQAILDMSTFVEGNALGIEPGIYTAHWETQTYGLLVNPAMTGITADAPPADTGALIAALVAALPEGQFSVASSLVPQLMQAVASNWLSDEEIAATFRGEAPWEADPWRRGLQLLVDLRAGGVLANDALPGGQSDNPDVESSFFTQSLGMMFDASPGVAVGLATNPEFEDYISLPLPPMADGTMPPRSPGVPGKGAVVNPRGDHPEEALAFVRWLTEPEQQRVFAQEARILPTHPALLEAGDVPVQLEGFAQGVGTLQTMSETFVVDAKTAIVAEAQRVVLGETDVDAALAVVQAAQERAA